tara:strand:+ start:183 stop:839 length:657 start_codon:yes stop_codon:yes gene_type:complete
MEAEELKPQILATIDDLNQYLNGNVTALGLIDTMKDTINYIEDYAMTIRENKDFDLRKYLAENRLLKEDQTDLFVKAGFSFDDGLLGGVGSGGGGYYDFISDKISGYHIDKFDEEEFNNWYDNFSKKDFNSLVYDSKLMGDYEIDPSGLPKGIHQLDTAGAGEVMDDKITIYAYPTLVDENGGEFITIFSLDKDGNIVPEISKEEVKAKLSSNEYSII